MYPCKSGKIPSIDSLIQEIWWIQTVKLTPTPTPGIRTEICPSSPVGGHNDQSQIILLLRNKKNYLRLIFKTPTYLHHYSKDNKQAINSDFQLHLAVFSTATDAEQDLSVYRIAHLTVLRPSQKNITLLHSERPKLHTILAFRCATGL